MVVKKKNDFDSKLVATVDEVLKETFGEPGRLIYSYLASHSLRPEQIPQKLEVFADCIENFSCGGSVVKSMILKRLYSSFGLEFGQTARARAINRKFSDQITELRNSIVS